VVARGTVKRILGSGYGWKPLTAFLLGGFPATIHEPNDEADQRDEGHDVYGRSVSSSGNSIVLMTALYALCSPNVPLVENRFCVRGRSGAALCAWQFWPSSLGRSRHCHGRQRYTQANYRVPVVRAKNPCALYAPTDSLQSGQHSTCFAAWPLAHTKAKDNVRGAESCFSMRSASTRSAIASVRANASSRVLPYDMTPGSSGISAIQRPSSSRSNSTVKFI
jgi:hypothetical protein